MTSSQGLLVGLDIGGTKIEATVANAEPVRLATVVAPTDCRSPAHLVASIGATIDRALDAANAVRGDVAAIGGGVPGMVDHGQGVARLAVNLNLRDYPLGPTLADLFQCPVGLENDVRLAAVGIYGHLRQQHPERYADLRHLAYLSLGTGVAAGLILDGELFRGARGMAGEVGHIQVDPDGPLCNCGARGCLEMMISGTAAGLMAEAALEQDTPAARASALQQQRPVTSRMLFAAAGKEDPLAVTLTAQFGDYVARALYAMLLAYDVEVLALGGGVVRAGPAFLVPVRAGIDRVRATQPLAHSLFSPEMVVTAPEHNMGAWGGIMLAAEMTDRSFDQTKLRRKS